MNDRMTEAFYGNGGDRRALVPLAAPPKKSGPGEKMLDMALSDLNQAIEELDKECSLIYERLQFVCRPAKEELGVPEMEPVPDRSQMIMLLSEYTMHVRAIRAKLQSVMNRIEL